MLLDAGISLFFAYTSVKSIVSTLQIDYTQHWSTFLKPDFECLANFSYNLKQTEI